MVVDTTLGMYLDISKCSFCTLSERHSISIGFEWVCHRSLRIGHELTNLQVRVGIVICINVSSSHTSSLSIFVFNRESLQSSFINFSVCESDFLFCQVETAQLSL